MKCPLETIFRQAGHYLATATVDSTRRNLFYVEPGKERHIGTLVSGSRTKIVQFDADCERIVRALAQFDATRESESGESGR